MSLLPKASADFTEKKYWNDFFRIRGETPFEWYGDYEQLGPTLERYLRPKDKILHVGCGNSLLPEQLYDNGYRNIHNIDIVGEVVAKMKARNAKTRPEMRFDTIDATHNDLPTESYTAILDKGTLDALLPEEAIGDPNNKASRLLYENMRLLSSFTGRYITVSLAQPHVIEAEGIMLRVHQCISTGEESFKLPTFLLVATKFKAGITLPTTFEFCVGTSKKAQRLSSLGELLDAVASAQQYFMFCHRCRTSKLDVEASITMQDLSSTDGSRRFEITIVDDQLCHNGTYAVMIVPQGRENDWMFSTEKGRKLLLRDCNKERLAIVRLFRDQAYSDMTAIKNELNFFVRDFAPQNGFNHSIPFLTIGSDDIGWRKTVAKVELETGGMAVVEDVRVENAYSRRLLFLDSTSTVQSDVKIHVSEPYDPKKVTFEHGELASEYHRAMLAAFAIAARRKFRGMGEEKPLMERGELRCLILGLGGGTFASFIKKWIPNIALVGVELDSVILKLAKEHFGLVEDPRMTICQGDAIQFCKTEAERVKDGNGSKFDVVVVDLAGSTPVDSLTAPIPQILEHEALSSVKDLTATTGCVAVNVLSRDEDKRTEVKALLGKYFGQMKAQTATEDLNEVLLCLPEGEETVQEWDAALQDLVEHFRKQSGSGKKKRRKGKAKAANANPTAAQPQTSAPSGVDDLIQDLCHLRLK